MRWLLPALLLLVSLAAACGAGGPKGGTYLALGDSLSTGVGASEPAVTAFVPLVQQGLGEGFQLLNLAEAGDTSQELLDHGHLEQAAAAIQQQQGDDDPDNDVRVVSLTIGGNDLLELFRGVVQTGTCPNLEVSLQKLECINPFGALLQRYEINLETILTRLQQANPDLPIVLLTIHNPLSGALPVLAELADLALEGLPNTPIPEGVNDIIRAQAQDGGVIAVDVYPLFQGKAGELMADLVHPNDAGYRIMADAVIAALEDLL